MGGFDKGQWIGIAIVLGDIALVLLLACVALVLWNLSYRRSRKVTAATAALGKQGRDEYLQAVKAAVQAVVARYRKECRGTPAALDRPDGVAAERSALGVILQLQYGSLRRELECIEADATEFWAVRRGVLGKQFRQVQLAEEALVSALSDAGGNPGGQDDRPSGTAGSSEPRHRLEVDLGHLRRRVMDLEGYRTRFHALHAAALEETAAGRKMRGRIERELGDGPGADGVRAALEEYEAQGRAAMDAALSGERGAQEPGGGAGRSARHRALRERQRGDIARYAEETAGREYARLRESVRVQQRAIAELKGHLQDSESAKERMRHHYRADLARLENVVGEFELAIARLEKENYRQRRRIRRLTADAESRASDREAVTRLEATVDRFAAQTLEMQNRIDELESERHRRESEELLGGLEDGAAVWKGGAEDRHDAGECDGGRR